MPRQSVPPSPQPAASLEPTAPAPPPVEMATVFVLLCGVLRRELSALPDVLHVDEVAMCYADGNHVLAWQQMVDLLGVYYGRPIRLA